MEKLLEILLYFSAIIVPAFCGAIVVYIFSTLFNKTKYPKKNIIKATFILSPLSLINFCIVMKLTTLNWIIPIISVFTYLIIVLWLYRTTKLKTIFIILSYFTYTFTIELASVLLITLIGKEVSYFTSNTHNYSIMVIFTNLLHMSSLSLIYYIITKKFKTISFKESYKYLLYQALAIIVCLIPSMYLMFSNSYNFSLIFLVINAFQLIVVSAFSIIYVKNGIHFKDTELELENTKLHNKALSTINENIRGFKHDMGNMVQSINGYLAVGNIDGVKSYCQNLLHGFNDINLLSILSPKIINDPAIYGIVVGKMLYARENNLKLSLDVGLDVSKINFPSFELSRIIGILLDNAIEASLESDERKLKLEMYHDENRKCDVIIIGNSVKDPAKVDIIKMFEKNYSTKENPSGFGLYEVLKFFKKNNKGDIVPNIDYGTNFFTQTLIFNR